MAAFRYPWEAEPVPVAPSPLPDPEEPPSETAWPASRGSHSPCIAGRADAALALPSPDDQRPG